MRQKCETPAGKAGASRNLLAGRFRYSLNSVAIQAQFLIAAHHVRPELAAMVAALALGGGQQ